MKKIIVLLLLVLLAIFQYQLWFKPDGIKKTLDLKQAIANQKQINNAEKKHNNNLQADVSSLEKDNSTLEEHVRNDLGMIKKGETFYQVIK